MTTGKLLHLEPSDEALCSRVAARDVKAFEALYDRYAWRVYAWAAHLLGPRQAEDETQEIFARLWVRAAQFDPARGAFEAWFWAITRHHLLRQARRLSEQRRLLIADEISGLVSTAIAEGVDVEEAAFAAEAGRRALAALGQLPEEQRRVLVMSYFLGLSQAAIAVRLSLPLGTVKKRARLGMQKLRRALGKEEPEDPAQTNAT